MMAALLMSWDAATGLVALYVTEPAEVLPVQVRFLDLAVAEAVVDLVEAEVAEATGSGEPAPVVLDDLITVAESVIRRRRGNPRP